MTCNIIEGEIDAKTESSEGSRTWRGRAMEPLTGLKFVF